MTVHLAGRPPLDVTTIVESVQKALLKRPDEEHPYWLDRLSALACLAVREVDLVGGRRAETMRLSRQLQDLIAEINEAPAPAEGA